MVRTSSYLKLGVFILCDNIRYYCYKGYSKFPHSPTQMGPFCTTGEMKTSTATADKMRTTNLQQCPPTHNRASNMNSTPPRLASSTQHIYFAAQIMDIAAPYKLGQLAQDQDMLHSHPSKMHTGSSPPFPLVHHSL